MLGSRFGMFMLYQVRDQQVTGTSTEPEAYFGALQHQAQPKGAYTTQVQELLASH
jgi:3-methyladenine DNA glycosylase Mpg